MASAITQPKLRSSDMAKFRQYEKDERSNLREIVNQMNTLHSRMGGRDRRPERVAIEKCLRILQAEIDRQNLIEVTKPLQGD